MSFTRLFFLATLLITLAPRPTRASTFAASLQALLTEKDCEVVPELLGDWTGNSDLGGIWTLQQVGERKYRLVEQTEGESNPERRAAFDICVAHLGGHLFFDATSQELRPDGEEVFGKGWLNFWIPIHIIGRLDIEKNALHFRLLDNDWLQEALSSGRVHLTTARSDDDPGLSLVGPSKELKEFAARFAADPQAFSFDEDFERALKKDDAKKN
jgi:hypothetical protein